MTNPARDALAALSLGTDRGVDRTTPVLVSFREGENGAEAHLHIPAGLVRSILANLAEQIDRIQGGEGTVLADAVTAAPTVREQLAAKRASMDPRDRWQIVGEHEVRSDRRLEPGERAPRNWSCSCGGFTLRGYDNAARIAFVSHATEVGR